MKATQSEYPLAVTRFSIWASETVAAARVWMASPLACFMASSAFSLAMASSRMVRALSRACCRLSRAESK